MWDEEVNKKIKDAADQYHPAYDDTAWNKMEQMLDKHLPQKKGRRRIIYFLPLILVLSGVIFFVISRKETTPSSKIQEKTLLKSNPENSLDEHQRIAPAEVVAKPNPVKPGRNLVSGVIMENDLSKETSVNTVNPAAKSIDKLSLRDNVDIISNPQRSAENLLADNQGDQREDRRLSIEAKAQSNSSKKSDTSETTDQTEIMSGKEIVSDNSKSLQSVHSDIRKDEKDTIKPGDVVNAENLKDANRNIKQKKTKKSFIQNFGIGLGFGPDVSSVGFSNIGKLNFTYGAELRYSFTDKFTLRTGFYVAKKIYTADEDDYHIPPGSTANYDHLVSVDANCKIYEIPLVLSYNFGKIKNHNWFVSAGFSSYFMKKESYVYFYKYPSGVTSNRSWGVTNKNEHYFSVLDFSAGYQYSINKRFSFIAEPYIKLPLSGVGVGKIKLNSAGVLFTVAVKPIMK